MFLYFPLDKRNNCYVPAGRPSGYTPELAEIICEAIATTDHGLQRICASESMPNACTVYRWLVKYPEFSNMYARAREMQAEILASQVLPIADDASADTEIRYREDGSEYEAVNQEHINRSRLRVDARKWLAAKLAPRKYGDLQQIQQRLVDEQGRDREPLTVVFVGSAQVARAVPHPLALPEAEE